MLRNAFPPRHEQTQPVARPRRDLPALRFQELVAIFAACGSKPSVFSFLLFLRFYDKHDTSERAQPLGMYAISGPRSRNRRLRPGIDTSGIGLQRCYGHVARPVPACITAPDEKGFLLGGVARR